MVSSDRYSSIRNYSNEKCDCAAHVSVLLADVYTIGEVDNGDVAVNAPYQGPLDATLNYPMYWTLRHVRPHITGVALLPEHNTDSCVIRQQITTHHVHHKPPKYSNTNSPNHKPHDELCLLFICTQLVLFAFVFVFAFVFAFGLFFVSFVLFFVLIPFCFPALGVSRSAKHAHDHRYASVGATAVSRHSTVGSVSR